MDDICGAYLEYGALEKGLSERTISAYLCDLNQFRRWLENGDRGTIAGAGTAEISEYANWLGSNGASPGSIRRKLSSLRGFYRFMQSEGLREDDPAGTLHAPRMKARLPHAISVDAASRLVEAWEGESPLSVRNRALMELAYGAGLRESELAGMTVARVHLEEALVRPMGKGSKERIVPIGGAAVKWLTAYIENVRPGLIRRATPLLFLTFRGNRLSRMTVWNIVRKAAEMSGVEGNVHPHTLRHSFATHLLQGGADLRVVQELLGHADIRTTEIYTGVDRTYLRGVMERCHPRAGAS